MASQMVVPASKDTLFMRGFSAKLNIQDIREFFTEQGGRCTVEFFKEADTKDRLYVALRFDTKDIAKEVLNRYDNAEVLGDRITISWFKDLRRARAKEMARRQQRSWSPTRNSGSYWDRDRSSGRYDQGRRWSNRDHSPVGTRYRKYGSSSRSRSPSRSRSRSRSYSRSRSRSPSIDRGRSPTPERRSKKHRSRSRGRDRSPSPRDMKRDSSTRDDGGRWRERSRERTPNRASSPQKYSDRGSEPRRSMRDDQGSEPRSYDASPPRQGKHVRSTVATVDSAPRKSPPHLGGGEGELYRDPKDYSEGHGEYKQARDVKQSGRLYEDAEYDGQQQHSDQGRRRSRFSDAYKSGRDNGSDYGQERNGKRPYSPAPVPVADREPVVDRIQQDPVSPPYKQEQGFRRHEDNYRDSRLDDRGSKLPGRDVSDVPMERDRSPDGVRHKRSYEDDYSRVQEFDDHRAGGHMEDLPAEPKKRKFEDLAGMRDSRRDQYEERSRPSSSSKARGSRYIKEEAPSEETELSRSLGPLNGGMGREVDRGALGLPQDQLRMVKEKKEEIEKSYKQDCETFAAVVKMLVSKDPGLEDKLQLSLRENLKEIGQRCIYELREYMERVKAEDDARR